MLRLIALAITLLSLIACGGGGGGTSGGGGGDPLTLVDGNYYSAAVTAQLYPSLGYDVLASCTIDFDPNDPDKPDGLTPVVDEYYESDHFMVWTDSPDYRDGARIIASAAEESFDIITEKFGMTPDEALSNRPQYSDLLTARVFSVWAGVEGSIPNLRWAFEDLEGASAVPSLPDPIDGEFELTSDESKRVLYEYWLSLSPSEQEAAAVRASDYDVSQGGVGINLEFYRVPYKLQICISSWADIPIASVGSTTILIRYLEDIPSNLTSNDYAGLRRIGQHEMVHVLSYIMSGTFRSYDEGTREWWFEEGLAEYYSDGDIEADGDFNYIVYGKTRQDLEFFYNGLGPGQGDNEDDQYFYAVSHNAVSYILGNGPGQLNNGTSSVLEFWDNLKTSSLRTGGRPSFRPTITYNGVNEGVFDSPIFRESFDATFTDSTGTPFTLEYYEDHYLDIH